MANPKHLEILKRGVGAWNTWRKEYPEIRPDLNGAILSGARLSRAHLDGARLIHAHLDEARLRGARLIGARLEGATLTGADLTGATLNAATLTGADLTNARLDRAHLEAATLTGARLDRAHLKAAKLNGATLNAAHLTGVRLEGATLNGANLGATILVDLDLEKADGLKDVKHVGPSTVDHRTIQRFRGNAPENFLRGCGLLDWEIEATKLHAPNLARDQITDILYEIDRIRTDSPILFNPLFISYSHADKRFVEALESGLDAKRIRYWRDVHDLKAGRLETQIERGIRLNPTVLLVLSESSVESDWVRWEAQKARELEKELGRDVLCPVALDNAWKSCSWPAWLRVQIEDYYVLDFSEWMDSKAMASQFARLLEGLGINYPTTSGSPTT